MRETGAHHQEVSQSQHVECISSHPLWSMNNQISAQFHKCLLMRHCLSLEWEIFWRSAGRLQEGPGCVLNYMTNGSLNGLR